ncbi:MAG TPA: sialidase family protein [Mycobacteriales bacterium]|jgi:hypothetical protein
MRRRTAVPAAVAVALAAAAQPGGASPVRGTPFPQWDAPVLVSDAGRGAREISLAIDPRDERRMFACTPSGVINRQSEQSHYYVTRDGGRRWSYVDVEDGDLRQYAYEGGDCDVAYDAAGTMYVADTWVGDLSVGASRDGGRTWTGTPLAASVPVVDRPWVVGGPPGTVYVVYHAIQGQLPTLMWFTKSTDYGRTFSPAVPVTTANPSGTYTWEGNLVVAPGGRDLYAVLTRRVTPANPMVPGVDEDRVQLAYSHDGGLTWATRDVAVLPQRPTPATLYPVLALDGGGVLHATWSAPRPDRGDTPVYWTSSNDGGVTWRPPVALTTGVHAWAPWVTGGARAGQAAFAWLETPDDPAGEDPRWWFGAATRSPSGQVATGRTTRAPVWVGPQTNPEFEAVRYTRDGRLHLGMAVFRDGVWALYYQRQR